MTMISNTAVFHPFTLTYQFIETGICQYSIDCAFAYCASLLKTAKICLFCGPLKVNFCTFKLLLTSEFVNSGQQNQNH